MEPDSSVRRGRRRTIRLLIMIAGIVFFATFLGCGPKLKLGYEDPSFKSPQTYTRPVAVGGFVWSADPVERQPEVCAALGAVLWKRLEKDIGNDRMLAPTLLSETLDSADLEYILRSLEVYGGIDSIGSDRFIAAFGNSPILVVFGRMLEDRFETATNYTTVDYSQSTEIITRKVRVALNVFDPSEGKEVWRAEVSNSVTSSQPQEEDFSFEEVVAGIALGTLANAIFGGSDKQEPPPVLTSTPDLVGITWDICGELGKCLAGEKKK